MTIPDLEIKRIVNDGLFSLFVDFPERPIFILYPGETLEYVGPDPTVSYIPEEQP